MKRFFKLGVLFLSVVALAFMIVACGGEKKAEQEEQKQEIKKIITDNKDIKGPEDLAGKVIAVQI